MRSSGDPHLVVVGAGIVGLFTALHYQRRHPRHRVIVLERGPHPTGASVKNAGFACFGSPSELLADMDNEGADGALIRVEERWLGLLELRAELGDQAIGYEATGGHEIYTADDPLYTRVADRFDQLNQQLADIVGASVFQWDNAAIARFGLSRTAHLVRNDHEGPLHSGLLMNALMGKAQEAGVMLRVNSAVTAINEADGHAAVHLVNGELLRAGRVVVATNGYASELLPDLDIRPARGQVLLTSSVPGLRLRGTFHMNEGYFYFRDLHGAILLGGGRILDLAGEATTEDGVTDQIQSALEEMLRDVILAGRTFTIEQRWSGIMGFRSTGKTPLVEYVSPRVIAAVGLSGMGVAIGIRVARRAAALASE